MAQDQNLANATLASNFLGATPPNPTYPGQWWIDTGTTIDASGGPWLRKRNTANTAWLRKCHADADLISELVGQAYTAFTTGGTSGAFTLTPVPAITAYSGPMRYHVKFHAAGNGSDTINISGQGTKNLKQYDSGGNKVAPVITAGFSTDIFFDGTDVVILDPLPPTQSSTNPPIRQTVLSGPVDSSGLSAFGGSTGSSTVTASGTLKATCYAGADSNYTGSITNPSWTGLTTNGTMYLFLDITSAGVVSTASSMVQQVCQQGGTPANTNGLLTVNWQEGKCYLGNGSAAPQAYRVAVGEVMVAGNVVTAITWYALLGSYDSGYTSTLPAAGRTSKNHNLGVVPRFAEMWAECTSTDAGYSVGDIIKPTCNPSGAVQMNSIPVTTKTVSVIGGNGGTPFAAPNASTGATTNLTSANWKWKLVCSRGW
jgi:hypothetical protein